MENATAAPQQNEQQQLKCVMHKVAKHEYTLTYNTRTYERINFQSQAKLVTEQEQGEEEEEEDAGKVAKKQITNNTTGHVCNFSWRGV
ncbi:unnamed protein product [Ceratitis capitata]|uniref:(Mediterranean fruit fly) hypothetical protein n=1 Tax=Ceratitis capitata TaxID=7213 RepID=A0A811U423_CERCA|nr:unnamed protein product [Ceratitis capitata]